MRLLYLEPYYGGSHRAIADAFINHTQFDVDLLTMPARHWKWRLRGAAYHFVPRIEELERIGKGGWDVVICSSLLDVSLVRGMWATASRTPIVQYVHEHQFSYPGRSGLAPDANYPLTDFASALASDAVFFNSEYCRTSFLDGAGKLLSRMPDYRCRHVAQRVADKSAVLYPGCTPLVGEALAGNSGAGNSGEDADEPTTPQDERKAGADPLGRCSAPCILWNHRWEHDKNPGSFFEALKILDREGLDFCLAVTGGRYRGSPDEVFEEAGRLFADRILHWGFVQERENYSRIVNSCDIVVSTARQENFGLSVLEAVRSGLLPVLPQRLSYPELYGKGDAVFFDADEEEPVSLARSLRRVLADSSALCESRRRRRMQWVAQFDWEHRIADWDTAMESRRGGAIDSRGEGSSS